MLQRALHTTLATLYLFLSLGIGVHVHYCAGEVEGVSLYKAPETDCGACSSTSNCCDDEHVYVKLDVKQKLPTFFAISFSQLQQVKHIAPAIPDIAAQSASRLHYTEYAMPPPAHIPIYTQHCSFIFYG